MRAARHMRERVLRAVSMQRVLAVADIAAVVIKREHDTEAEKLLAERPRFAALVAVQQPRHRERDVEHVLDVVIPGIARTVFGMLAAIHRGEVLEWLLQAGRTRF